MAVVPGGITARWEKQLLQRLGVMLKKSSSYCVLNTNTLWKMNQRSLGFFPEAPLTNFVQNSQADPAQQYDGGRQDLLTFGWRQGKTV